VSSLDIAPTFLVAAGLEIPSSFSGRPLPGLQATEPDADEKAGDPRYLLIQNPYYQPDVLPARMRRQVAIRKVGSESVRDFEAGEQMLGVMSDAWKYLRGSKSEELYELKPDGSEQRVMTSQNKQVRDQMRLQLEAVLAEHPLELIAPSKINPELMQSLRALGYVE